MHQRHFSVSRTNLDKLQRVQNVLARVTAQAPWSVSATDLRRDLHWLPIRQRFIYKLSVLTYKALHTGQPYYLADLIDIYEPSRCLRSTNCHLLAVPSCVKLNRFLPLNLFVYLCLIIGILSLCTSAHLTVLSLFNPVLNLTFSLLPITSSHPHASASDLTFDFWCWINIWLTLTLTLNAMAVWYLVQVDLPCMSDPSHWTRRLYAYVLYKCFTAKKQYVCSAANDLINIICLYVDSAACQEDTKHFITSVVIGKDCVPRYDRP